MGWCRRLLSRLLHAVIPWRGEAEIARELAAHQTLLEDDYRRRGLSASQARAAAARALTAVRTRDLVRDARSFVWFDDLRRDVAHAGRRIRRSPGVAAAVLATFAVSIGATTAVATVVDHVLIRPLPLPDPHRLVRLDESSVDDPARGTGSAPPTVAEWRRRARTLDVITAIGGTSITMTGGAMPEEVIAMTTGPEFFALTGVQPAVGRLFDAEAYLRVANAALGPIAIQEAPSSPATLLISHELWQRQFGGDPGVAGRRVQVNGLDAAIIGVMPESFRFDETPWGRAEAWIPLVEAQWQGRRRFRQFTVIGRLASGATFDMAQTEMDAISRDLARAYPADNGGRHVRVIPLHEAVVGDVRHTLLILLAGAGCVLLIACANVTGLLVMRASARARDSAVQVAIGAGRARIVRQWITESAVLGLWGGLAGLGLAWWAVPLLVAHAPAGVPRLDAVTLDARLLALCVATALLGGVVCGLAAATGLFTERGSKGLRMAGAADAGPRSQVLRPALVILQVSLAVVLLVGAGLLTRTLLVSRAVDLGFEPAGVLTFGVNLQGDRYRSLAETRRFTDALVSELQDLPGVVDAGVGRVPLLGNMSLEMRAEGVEGPMRTALDVPSPGYFAALGLRRLSGRLLLAADDAAAPAVAVVSLAFARAAWGHVDVLGRRIRVDHPAAPWITVVGVIDDVRLTGIEAEAPPAVFIPYAQSQVATFSNFVVRTSGDAGLAVPRIRELLRRLDPSLAVTRVATMEERVGRLLAPRRFNAWLAGTFAFVACVLALVGVYGTMAASVAQRTSEIAVRLALGAGRIEVLRLVAARNLIAIAAGIGVGLVLVAGARRAVASMLFGVAAIDPLTFTVVPAGFAAVAAVAAIGPMCRALRVDPVRILRGD